MFGSITPHDLFQTQIHTLHLSLPDVLDGQASGVHDARVATRRIRELLPLLGGRRRKHLEDLYDRFRRLGRSLGRVRDVDVRIGLLESLETRIPLAAPSLVLLKQQREQERLLLLRKLIKRIERLDAARLIEMLDDRHSMGFRGRLAWSTHSPHTWRRMLGHILAERARAAADAIDHATGVYFPRRSHAARIAIKKLRYSMEIACETRVADCDDALREVKKTQEVLGDLHDRQDLLDGLLSQSELPDAGHVPLVRQVIDVECQQLHRKYLDKRKELLDICRTDRRLRKFRPRAVLTAGALALSSGVYAMTSHDDVPKRP